MRKQIFYSMLFCLIAIASSASAGSKKEEIRQLQQTIDSLNRIADRSDLNQEILKDDWMAQAYCKAAYFINPEEYSNDTARINEALRTMDWVMSHRIVVPNELLKKVNNYDKQKLEILYATTEVTLPVTSQRYQTLRQFCDEVMQERNKAATCTMPAGQLVQLRYEYDVLRSTPPKAKSLQLSKNEQGKWSLYHQKYNDLSGGIVADSLAATVRQMVEEGGIYREPTDYKNPPRFPDCPQKLDGKGKWSFTCEFEGGTIRISGSPDVSLSPACQKVIDYLINTYSSSYLK
ncbi:MAG: hypothetical protein J5671_09045 [Bacteroidaceae bacterium]|nr:hypothetical protein [Bacteroidaceae bacterium]